MSFFDKYGKEDSDSDEFNGNAGATIVHDLSDRNDIEGILKMFNIVNRTDTDTDTDTKKKKKKKKSDIITTATAEGDDRDEEDSEESDSEGKDFDPENEEDEDEEEEEEEEDDDDDENDENENDDDEKEQFLQRLKQKMNKRDEDGQTALHCAILSGSSKICKLLLEHGADPFATLEGSPAMHIACTMASFGEHKKEAFEITKMLLPMMLRHDVEDDYGRTALSIAAQHGSKEIAEYLIKNYEQPNEDDDLEIYLNQKDRNGRTALIWAANYNRADVLDLLLEQKNSAINIDEQDNEGNTALIYAVKNNSIECVKALMKKNANVDVENKKQESAKAIASRRAYEDISLILNGKAPSNKKIGKDSTAATSSKTMNGLIIAPDACLLHHSCPQITRGCSFDVPPENVQRLTCIMNPVNGTLRSSDFAESTMIDTTESPAQMVDVLRCHEYNYIKKVQKICDSLPDIRLHPNVIGTIDGDTTVCSHSFHAALCAAGAAIKAVDSVVLGNENGEKFKRVFCAVRPPGHHSGPLGPVGPPGDPIGQGSHGFCLINNVAVAAAYARCVHRHKGIKKVAIIDFDVHHGNGTEALVANTAPSAPKVKISTPWSSGEITTNTCKPWLDPDTDMDDIFFASVHGYGRANFYPGTGPTKDTKHRESEHNDDNDDDENANNDNTDPGYISGYSSAEDEAADGVVKDDQKVLAEIETSTFEKPPPRIVDVGMVGEGKKADRGNAWRRVWRAKVLPALDEFKPDLLFISAGFDAHSKDAIQGPVNLGVKELDYEWLTNELCEIANKHAEGRVVSVLEGGYRIQGKAVSAFGRSVASHCKALFATHNTDCFDEKINARVLDKEISIRREQREMARLERLERETEQLRRRHEERERELLRLQEIENGTTGIDDAAAGNENVRVDEAPAAPVEEVGGKRRRRGGSVDYAALNAKLMEQEQQQNNNNNNNDNASELPSSPVVATATNDNEVLPVPIIIDDDDDDEDGMDAEEDDEDEDDDDEDLDGMMDDAEDEDDEELEDA